MSDNAFRPLAALVAAAKNKSNSDALRVDQKKKEPPVLRSSRAEINSTDEDCAAEATSAESIADHQFQSDEARLEKRSNDEGEKVNARFESLLSSVAQLGLAKYDKNSGLKKYRGRDDERTPPQFLREFESSVLRCLDDFTKARYFATAFDYDLFVYALAIPFDKGYEEARGYFLELTWNDDMRRLEAKKLSLTDDDRELFGYYDGYGEMSGDSLEASAIELYIRAADCGIRSDSVLQNILTSRLPLDCLSEIQLDDYNSLESFAQALHRHCVVSKVRKDCQYLEDHEAVMYKLLQSYFTVETESD